jgi:hypothetical protein
LLIQAVEILQLVLLFMVEAARWLVAQVLAVVPAWSTAWAQAKRHLWLAAEWVAVVVLVLQTSAALVLAAKSAAKVTCFGNLFQPTIDQRV